MSEDRRLAEVLRRIDEANAADPTSEGPTAEPAALLYGRRMSEELASFLPEASDHLKIAVRAQHIERWTKPRASFPEGKQGYLAWRNDLKAFHAERVAEIMAEAGYREADRERVAKIVRKQGIKRDPEVQALEDVACLVFMRHYFADFAADREPGQIRDIVAKTARKMSPEGRARALAEFELPPDLAEAVENVPA